MVIYSSRADAYKKNHLVIFDRSPKVKALMKEMKQLQQNLPVHADASIFVLQVSSFHNGQKLSNQV